MPPKKSKSEDSLKQSKLFSKQPAKEQPESQKVSKNKSKKFNESSSSNEKVDHTSMWEYGDGKTPNKLKIANWNVNGIRAVMAKKDLEGYLQKDKPDILCLNETKIDHEAYMKTPIKFAGYYTYWNFCKCSAGYSGVAILSKYKAISCSQDLPQAQHSQQGRVLTLEFEQFNLVTAYIPNSGQKLDRLSYRVDDYDKSFQKHCSELRKKKTTIVCGDLNVCHQDIDIARPKGNEKTAGFTVQQRQSFTKFLDEGWVDTYRKLHPKEVKYSWWSYRTGGRAKNIGWRLDYFLLDEKSFKLVKESSINNNIFGSDHCPVQLDIEF